MLSNKQRKISEIIFNAFDIQTKVSISFQNKNPVMDVFAIPSIREKQSQPMGTLIGLIVNSRTTKQTRISSLYILTPTNSISFSYK